MVRILINFSFCPVDKAEYKNDTARMHFPREWRGHLWLSMALLLMLAVIGLGGIVGYALQPAETPENEATLAVAPLYTLAALAPYDPTTPTPVIALAAAGMAPPTFEMPQPENRDPQYTPLPFELATDQPTPPVAALKISTPQPIYLPLMARNYQPPPREPEPFVVGVFSDSQWPEPRAELAVSKIGLHTFGPYDPNIMEYVRRVKPRVVKSVGDYGWMREVKEVSPETVTIGRIYGYEEAWVGVLDPREAARQYIEKHWNEYQLNPFVDYWEGWNEFVWDSPAKLEWFGQFEAERACQMQALGFRAAVGGFAVGWPSTFADMEPFLPALKAARQCGGIFHLHEYNRPNMNCGVRTNVADIIPGAPPVRVPAGPLTLRYRVWYNTYLMELGIADLPLVISESGIDAVPAILCPDPGMQNGFTWKAYGDWWTAQGYGVDGPQAYVNQLAWYDSELQHDAYVIGTTVFSAGALGFESWDNFDLRDVLLPLANYAARTP